MDDGTVLAGTRRGSVPILCLGLLFGASGVAACGAAEEARDSVLRELALGSWACTPDVDRAAQPFTVRIEGDGTFGVVFDPVPTDEVPLPQELSGTWVLEGGDLEWALAGPRLLAPFRVPGFDALHLGSERLILENAAFFGPADGGGGVADEQVVDVEAHSKDSVTFSVPGGDPWTCDRQR